MKKTKRKKDSIQGRKITRKQALRELGDPKNWETENEGIREEFSKKFPYNPPDIRR